MRKAILIGMMALTMASAPVKADARVILKDTKKITYQDITHRKGNVLIEKMVGKVTTKKKDGKVGKYYISYKGVKCKKGDKILSYFVYDSNNNIEDDIVRRYDFVLSKNKKVQKRQIIKRNAWVKKLWK